MRSPRLFWGLAALVILAIVIAALAAAFQAGAPPSRTPAALATATPIPTPTAPAQATSPSATTAPTTPPAGPTPTSEARVPAPTLVPGDLVGLARAFPLPVALEHLRVLTSDEMDGRRAGTRGGERAAQYLADELEALGVQPLLPEGYFQTFPFTYLDLTGTPELARLAPEPLELEHRGAFRENVFGPAGGGSAEGELFVAGYAGGRNPFPLADIRGQPVLAITGGRIRGEEVIGQAAQAGAGALILGVRDPRGLDVKFSYIPPLADNAIPVVTASEEALDRLLTPAGLDVAGLIARVQSEDTPFLEGTGLTVAASVPLLQEERQSQNVVGLLPGSDPQLKEEYVVIGGHYDHVGRDPDGTLFAGANDNASGTAVTLALADHWVNSGFRPARSVIFAFWGAEEVGLVGSEYFVSHPPVPLEKIVGFINLDAVGQGDGPTLALDGAPVSQPLIELLLQSGQELGIPMTSSVEGGGGSDHQPFIEARVPAVLVIWQGFAGWIHVTRDTFENASEEKIAQVGQLAGLAGARLASGP